MQSIGVKAALLALRIYKTYFSIFFAGSCRYVPTCSVFAYQAIERFGLWRGSWLGLKRLLRCHPLSGRFGYDPVPEQGKNRASAGDFTGRADAVSALGSESLRPEAHVGIQ